MDFDVPVDHKEEFKGNERKYKYLNLAKELKTTMEHKTDADTNKCIWNNPQRVV